GILRRTWTVEMCPPFTGGRPSVLPGARAREPRPLRCIDRRANGQQNNARGGGDLNRPHVLKPLRRSTLSEQLAEVDLQKVVVEPETRREDLEETRRGCGQDSQGRRREPEHQDRRVGELGLALDQQRECQPRKNRCTRDSEPDPERVVRLRIDVNVENRGVGRKYPGGELVQKRRGHWNDGGNVSAAESGEAGRLLLAQDIAEVPHE